LESGSRPRGGVKNVDSGIPSIGGEHLTYDNGFNITKIRYVPESFYYSMRKGQIEIDDILIVKDGATTGKTVHVKDDFPFESAVVNEHVFICRPSKLIDPKFLFYYLWSKEGQDRILKNFKGAAQGGINRQFALDTLVPITSFEYQQKTATKIDNLIRNISKAEAILSNIPEIINGVEEAIVSQAVSGKLTSDWRLSHLENDQEFSSELDSDLPKIPETWQWQALKDISVIRGGVTKGRHFKENDQIIELPYLRVANVQDGYLKLDEIKYIPIKENEKEKYILKAGDILLTEGGDRDKLGRGTVWKNEIEDCTYQNHIFRARVDAEKVLPEYISLATKSSHSRSYLYRNANQTVNLASINMTVLGNLLLPIPGFAEQVEIMRRVDSVYIQLESVKNRFSKTKIQFSVIKDFAVKHIFDNLLDPSLTETDLNSLIENIKNERAAYESQLPSNKSQTENIVMKLYDSLAEILADNNGKLTPKELWEKSNFKDDIDAFYDALKHEVELAKTIQESPDKEYLILNDENR
jgi:type I restriction enzyme S subunit